MRMKMVRISSGSREEKEPKRRGEEGTGWKKGGGFNRINKHPFCGTSVDCTLKSFTSFDSLIALKHEPPQSILLQISSCPPLPADRYPHAPTILLQSNYGVSAPSHSSSIIWPQFLHFNLIEYSNLIENTSSCNSINIQWIFFKIQRVCDDLASDTLS